MGEILPLPRGRAGWGRGSGEGSPVPGEAGLRGQAGLRREAGLCWEARLGWETGLREGRKTRASSPDLNPLKQGLEGPWTWGKAWAGAVSWNA